MRFSDPLHTDGREQGRKIRRRKTDILGRGQTAKNLPRVAVYPVLQAADFRGGIQADIITLRNPAPYHAVYVFIGSPFAGAVRVAEIKRSPVSFIQA